MLLKPEVGEGFVNYVKTGIDFLNNIEANDEVNFKFHHPNERPQFRSTTTKLQRLQKLPRNNQLEIP